jgi:DNA-binding transcriptional MocR family regulator
MERKRIDLIRRLRELIKTPGAFPDGKLPPERELAKTLGASRNLLREAIVSMEVMGCWRPGNGREPSSPPPSGAVRGQPEAPVPLARRLLAHLMEIG